MPFAYNTNILSRRDFYGKTQKEKRQGREVDGRAV
jgi:hypothetical protein